MSRHSQKLQSPHGGGLGAPCSLPGCWVWSRPSPISSAPRGAFPAQAPRSLQRCPAPRRDASQPQAEELVPAFWGQIWRFQLRLSLPAGRAAPRALQSRGLASAPAPAAACSSNAFIASSHPPSPLHAALGISHTAAGLRGGSFFLFYFFVGWVPACELGTVARSGVRLGCGCCRSCTASASSSVSFHASSPHLQSMKAGRRLRCCPHQLSPQCPSPWPRGSALPGWSSLGTRSGEAPWRGRLSAGINKCEMMVGSSGSIQPFLPFPWLINLMAL